MVKKNKQIDKNSQQLNIFDYQVDNNIAENKEKNLENYDNSFEESNRDVVIEQEFLPTKLLKDAILKQNPDDVVMRDFAGHVLPHLFKAAIGVTAKGGKWIEEKLTIGEIKSQRALSDQSLNTHILNGLFAANFIEQQLEKLNTTIKRVIREFERRIGIAAFVLHDFEKFDYKRFPEMPQKYQNVQDIRKLTIAEHREIIDVIIRQLNLNHFINPDDPENYKNYLDDLLCIAYNAQTRWDTNWNFSQHSGLFPRLGGDKLISLTGLACLADRLSSIIKHPQDALSSSLNSILGQLSDRQLKLTYHSIAENRGVLTNIVNNALIDEYVSFNTSEQKYYQPILYLPTGVIYLIYRNAPTISIEDLPERVVDKIKSLCTNKLRERQTGFSRDGKGIKYADYYQLFFKTPELIQVGLDATLKILKDGKKPVSQERSISLIKFQKQGILSTQYDFEFPDDIRIDKIAEFGDLISRKIWDEKFRKIELLCKQNKNLSKPPELDLIFEVVKFWNLLDYLPAIREIQRINESLKEHKLKGNTGGLPLEWYYLAAKYFKNHPGIEDVRSICEQLLTHIIKLIIPIIERYQLPDGWDDLRLWVQQVLMLPTQATDYTSLDKFLEEFNKYKLAKKSGRGKQLVCSISHSAYTVTEQMESAVLFTPQVYTNKQTLGGSNAKRNISSIASIEIMLRQILMSQTEATGKNFEEAKYRYLYFYPTYYCTPETNVFLHQAYEQIRQARFDTGIRNHFISKDLKANFELERYQNVDIFHLDNTKQKSDKVFKLSYPDNQPLTFYFMALPPEVKGKDKKPTDTESWIMPAWLGLVFPMILDVKTVVSESPIPPFNDGAEFPETVFLDSAPQAIRVLTKKERFRLDYILEGWSENNKNYPSPLNILTAAYAIHLDVNTKQGKGVYDPNWGKLTELAKDFETTPLSVFTYLNEWVRKQKIDSPDLSKIKLYTYYFYPCFDPYTIYKSEKETLIVKTESPMNHPKKLTELYRQFYRAKSSRGNPIKANAILKPIDEAASIILNADYTICSGDALVDLVAARIFKLMERVHSGTAEGRWIIAERDKEREKILEFAHYFVIEVFEKLFEGDRARLAGRQLNIIRDTCEFLYRLENDKERQKKYPKNSNDSTIIEEE